MGRPNPNPRYRQPSGGIAAVRANVLGLHPIGPRAFRSLHFQWIPCETPMTHDTNAESSRRSTLLAVGGRSDDFRSLRTILEAGDWNVREAASYDEAANLMEDGPPAVIACDAELPDGDWKDLFHLAAALENPPPVVVVSRHADERLRRTRTVLSRSHTLM